MNWFKRLSLLNKKEAVEEATAEESGRLHNVTKQQIITLFSHGNSVESISEQLNVPVSTVQFGNR